MDLSFFSIIFLVKVALLLLLFIFSIFLLIIIIQVNTMNKLVKQNVVSAALFFIAVLLFLGAVSLFVATLVIL